jgi:tripartite-type tricarboxylate transporter receptor subunit TctC
MAKSRVLKRRAFLKLAGAGALTAGLGVRASAQALNWPDKPVRVIVPFAAGGGTDLVARPWADKLTQAFGQQFVVENRGGASGMIGAEAAAKAAPDGYTFLCSSNTAVVSLPLLRKTPYDPNMFAPVARVGDTVTGFVVHPSLGLKTFKEMIEYAKKNPGKIAFGSSGPGTVPHLRMEMLQLRAGIELLHVPYRGGADALTDLLANNVQMMNEPSSHAHIKAGKILLLNINHTTRSPDFPEAPTLIELGYPNTDVPLWFTLYAPAGTPREIIEKVNAKVREISATDEMKGKLLAAGAAPVIQTVEEIIAFREADRAAMAELIKFAKIKID